MSEYLEAYNYVGKHFLRVDDGDDLLYERYSALMDALWYRLTDEERTALTKEDLDEATR